MSPLLAHSYRAAALARGVRVSDLLIEELRAANQDVKAGRGDTLPRASRPGRRKNGEEPTGRVKQLKWPMDDDEYRSIQQALASVGSSPTAVLRTPQHVRVTHLSRSNESPPARPHQGRGATTHPERTPP